eukprot:COSAG03_NODE_7686_length_884_cov_1.308280_2_plen_23_part_01
MPESLVDLELASCCTQLSILLWN